MDKEFADAPNVVVLRVRSVEKLADSEKGYGYGGIKTATLSVERVFKGNLKIGDTLTLAQGGGADCIWTFDEQSVGEDYLFYLGSKPLDSKQFAGMIASTSSGKLSVGENVWVASTCSRSGNVKYRNLDLKYLENISSVQGKTRISGSVSQLIESATETDQREYRRLGGRYIKIVGNGRDVNISTDQNGDYEIYDLPPGKYKLSVDPIPGYKLSPFDWTAADSIDIEIKPGHHFETDFTFYINNSISGKLLDSNQKALKDVCLDLYPAGELRATNFRNFDCTNENGEFKFNQIPEGKYLIVVNDENEISARQPFGTFYYPDKIKKEEAHIVSIGAGEHLRGFLINAPKTAEIVTIKGRLLFENGQPAIDESVKFFSNESLARQKDKEYKTEDSRASTDKYGSFEIRILKGQKGRLFGSMMTYLGEYEKCSKLEKLILAKIKNPNGITVTDIETPPVEIVAVTDMVGIELKFPFPACNKSKVD